ncbi:hypothetical protein M426DRAFT_136142 [Hypoxylon sp. CI-4A]|nr:hypothetical protein M426DRAFT_136142 [Hypoxylon sp. CI-4A]
MQWDRGGQIRIRDLGGANPVSLGAAYIIFTIPSLAFANQGIGAANTHKAREFAFKPPSKFLLVVSPQQRGCGAGDETGRKPRHHPQRSRGFVSSILLCTLCLCLGMYATRPGPKHNLVGFRSRLPLLLELSKLDSD